MKRLFHHPVLRITLLYLLFGVVWIVVSDKLTDLLVTDTHTLTVLQNYKGWSFIAVSALMISLIAQLEFRGRSIVESARRDSEEKYRMLMLHANDGIVIADVQTGAILEVNQKIEKLTGRPATQLIGKHFSQLHPESDTDRCRTLLNEALAKGHALTSDLCILHRDGHDIPVEISTNIITIGTRQIIQGIFRDITRRQAAEEAQLKEQKRSTQYLDIAGVMIVAVSRTGSVTLINRKGSTILGFSEEEIIGKNWFDWFIPERLRAEAKLIFSRFVEGGIKPTEEYELPVLRKDGTERVIAWHTTEIKDQQGQVVTILSSGEDVTDRKHVEEQARKRQEHLATLHSIDMIISSSLDLRVTLDEILHLVISQLRVDAAAVLLLNPHTQELEYSAIQGFRDARIRKSKLRLGEGIAGRAALEHRSIGMPNLHDVGTGFLRTTLFEGESFISYHAIPLIAKGQVQGVLEILHRSPLEVDDEWMAFIESIAAQAAIAIDNATLFYGLQRSNTDLILAYDTTIEGWARALELRDRETEGHTKRATETTVRLARTMGMNEAELIHVRRGALLHDIGKMSIPDSILLKTGPLTEEEWQIMRRHPLYAYELLSPIAYLRPALDIPYCHHERWDGAGYPRGLKGEKIPLAARIFALADIWDALTHERRYHAAWPEVQIKEYIRSLAGSQFDPKVVDVFLSREFNVVEKLTV